MPEATMFGEKRVYPRFYINIPVKYRVIEEQKELDTVFDRKKNERATNTMDVSLGGLYIVPEKTLKVGTILRLDISLPDNAPPISTFSEVVWSNDEGAGIHFMVLKENDLELLKRYLDKISDGG